MAKAYCKWPAIIGIIIGCALLISILACCFRCLCCGLSFCPSGRRRTKRSTHPSAFKPAPYQGYQPANTPHGYAPPQFAHFDVSKNKAHEDSLPAMPSWDSASQKRVLQQEDRHNDVELERMEQKAPMLAYQAPSPTKGYAEMGSPVTYQQHGAKQDGDFGNPYSYNAPNSHGMPTTPQRYDSPGDFEKQSASSGAYMPYAPSVSTNYEPDSMYGGQEMGTAYLSQSYDAQPPGILQAGRKPGPGF